MEERDIKREGAIDYTAGREPAKQREMTALEKKELEEMNFGKEQIIERLNNFETMERKVKKQKLCEREQEMKRFEELQETWLKKKSELKKEKGRDRRILSLSGE